jgi:hypothetical protein
LVQSRKNPSVDFQNFHLQYASHMEKFLSSTSNSASLNTARLRYARFLGVVVGVFLIAWGIFGLYRWPGWLGEVQCAVMVSLGGFYAIAFTKRPNLQHHFPKKTCFFLCILTLLLAFSQIAEVIELYKIAVASGHRLRIPAPQGILIFISLFQLPVWIFNQKPQWLE